MKYFLYCRKSQEAEDRQVLSLPAQRAEAERRFAAEVGTTIAGVFEEAMSAKAPGRPIFNDMMARLEAGEADGIIAWAPDRLARNSMDGGRIVYLIDQGVIRDLKFLTYTFENNPQGKFMLAIMFGQSKYYSDALSENVKRGNRAKIAAGWRPNLAPLGYLNDLATKTIIPDPVHFPLIKQMFQLLFEGRSPRDIALIARDEWGFRTPKRRKIGGVPLALSSIYKILSNEFYAGLILWGGQVYPGKHTPVVSLEDFERARAILARPNQQRPHTYRFAFTSLIRCGACALMVTAEHKRNRFGRRYVYYHCTRRLRDDRCTQPSIEQRDLERQIATFLETLRAPAWLTPVLLMNSELDAGLEATARRAQQLSLKRARADTERQLGELTGLRVRELIGDGEFVTRRATFQKDLARIAEELAKSDASRTASLEPWSDLIWFSVEAANCFRNGDYAAKRQVVEIAGSNPTLTDKTLSIQAAKPFELLASFGNSPDQLASVDDIRTLDAVRYLRLQVQTAIEADPTSGIRLARLSALRRQFGQTDDDAEQRRLAA